MILAVSASAFHVQNIRRAKKIIDDLEKNIAEAEQEERNIDAARDAARASVREITIVFSQVYGIRSTLSPSHPPMPLFQTRFCPQQ